MKEAQKAKDTANKRLHEAGQTYGELLAQTVPLRVEIAELKDAVETSKAKLKSIEDRCVTQEVKLGEVEGALNAKTEAFDLLQADFSKLRAETDEALAELASQAERFKKIEQELVDDAVSTFADGFTEALAQAVCANPRIDVFCCGPLNHIVDGKVVPLEIPED